ncbi:MAG: MlaE family lipid ABC transporter permease subunit [Burkholderiales bacterium]
MISDLHAAAPPGDGSPASITSPPAQAAIAQPKPGEFALSGSWTALGINTVDRQLDTLPVGGHQEVVVDGTGVLALDTVGVWVLQHLMHRLTTAGGAPKLRGWRPEFERLIDLIGQNTPAPPVALPRPPLTERVGRATMAGLEQAYALMSFIGESALATMAIVRQPARLRWRPILYNIQSAGFDALPIVGLLSFLLGIVVAYQGADQLQRYGANIFVTDLVGVSMLREFAPLLTAIIVAGRSGSAYAAQIGTMAVTEEIDAMRTLGIAPLELLVLPKVFALVIALPLLTVFADVCGIFGGMLMAQAKLGVTYSEFMERLPIAIDISTFLIGVGKAPVFAAIIAVTGCFQGFRTHGGADSVGRQTTRSVVHATFLVIVADSLFSVVFSILNL